MPYIPTTPNYLEARESPITVRAGEVRFFDFVRDGVQSCVWKLEDVTLSTIVDVTSTLLSGGGSIADSYVRSPQVSGFTAGRIYRLTATCTKDGITTKPFLTIISVR